MALKRLRTPFFVLRPLAPVGILEECMWEALFSFRPLVAQAILFIFSVTT
ncbi:hypothetical protein E2C01_018928 [Portunus trituberculatus]|uniref:Uncharacterized protein n=1 Tax=Portunus trituberculatus TaxID=210409 RepID=A0A5B7DXT5_PORTR|nr:hypothetical protein [Portunus trituberculatus]